MAQLINEAKRFQLLAGLITESQINEIESQQQSDLEKKAFEFFNSPEVSKLIDQSLTKLSPEDKKELQSTVSNISEAVGSGFSSFLNIVHKAEEKASSLEEAGNEKNDLKTKVGKVLSGFGSANIMSMGMLPSLVALAIDHFANTNIINTASQAIGDGSIAAGLSVVASLIGGGILWAIGKKMQAIKDSDNEHIEQSIDIDSVVNEALETFRKSLLNEVKLRSFDLTRQVLKNKLDTPQGDVELKVGLNNVLPKKFYGSMDEIREKIGKEIKIGNTPPMIVS